MNSFISHFSERQNNRNSRDRLLEEQNAAYLDSLRADEEKVNTLSFFHQRRMKYFTLKCSLATTTFT